MGRLLEGFWDCKYCDNKRIGGSIRECPNCGKPRDKTTKFYLDTIENRYVPEEEAVKINKNPDWICVFCDQLNSDNDDTCISCGAPRTAENLNYFENKEKKSEISGTDNISNDISSRKTHSISSGTHNFFSTTWRPILIFLLIAFSIFGIFSLFQPKEYQVNIKELSWERTINIESYQTVQENAWTLPPDGRLLYTREEYSHSEPVLDHYETKTREVAKERISGYESYVSGHRDLGNGYFEEIISERPIYETYYETETYEEPVYISVPIYRTKYYYEIDKWIFERSVVTSGTDKSPYWGDTRLTSDERTSTQNESYLVKGIDLKTDKNISFYISFEDWSSLDIGKTFEFKVSFGHGEIIE